MFFKIYFANIHNLYFFLNTYVNSGEYHMYRPIPLHSCDYLNKSLIKTNVATGEDNSRKEM